MCTTSASEWACSLHAKLRPRPTSIVPIPDSGVPAAIGYAQESGMPFELGIIRNHYVGRTFIEPEQRIRQLGVKLKHSANASVIRGNRVVLIDDSVVRGTTSKKIVQLMYEAGAGRCIMRISSRPSRIPTITASIRQQDGAAGRQLRSRGHARVHGPTAWRSCRSTASIAPSASSSAMIAVPQFTDHCFTGEYPTSSRIRTDRCMPGSFRFWRKWARPLLRKLAGRRTKCERHYICGILSRPHSPGEYHPYSSRTICNGRCMSAGQLAGAAAMAYAKSAILSFVVVAGVQAHVLPVGATQINTGGETGAYHASFCPPLAGQLKLAQFNYRCEPSAGTRENMDRVAADPRQLGFAQLDVFALESRQMKAESAFTIVRQDDVRECVFAVTRNKQISNWGEFSANAGNLRFILPPATSGSAGTFRLLRTIDPDGLGRAKAITHANSPEDAIRQALALRTR